MAGRVLYWGSGSIPCWKVMLVLAEKGIDYESKRISFDEEGQRSAEVVALNPRGQVPAFKDGDAVICESYAICLWLESKYPDQGTKLLPSDAVLRARVLQKGFEASENLMRKAMEEIPYYIWDTTEETRDKERLDASLEKCREELIYWNKYLGLCGHSYLAGDEFTLADCLFFPFIAFAWRMSLNLARFPYIKDYYELVQKRPSVQATWPYHWKEGEPQPEKVAFFKYL